MARYFETDSSWRIRGLGKTGGTNRSDKATAIGGHCYLLRHGRIACSSPPLRSATQYGVSTPNGTRCRLHQKLIAEHPNPAKARESEGTTTCFQCPCFPAILAAAGAGPVEETPTRGRSVHPRKRAAILPRRRGAGAPGNDTLSVEFRTQDGCRLGIGRYPDFAYNAQGGRGVGAGRGKESGEDGAVLVEFDVASLYIPPMSGATTRFLGLPLPPFLKIDILPEALGGTIDRATGQVDLKFRSRFCFSVGSIYKAPPLFVDTTLTSEESRGAIRSGRGERLDGEERCKLVGVAVVDPIDDLFMNTFLRLPTECIAYLNATISIAKPR
ncbi:hypothetical protein EJB05_19506, partial [Eragrostis curvula]